jgi:hypothetical protein
MFPSLMNPQTNMPEFVEVVKDYIADKSLT